MIRVKERGRPRPQQYDHGKGIKLRMALGTFQTRGCAASLLVSFNLLRTSPSDGLVRSKPEGKARVKVCLERV